MRRLVIAIAVGLTACRQELTVALPFEEGTRAIVLAVQQGERLTLHAFDADLAAGERSIPLQLTFADDGDVGLTALLYVDTLASKGLTPGVVARGAAGESTRSPPSPEHTYAAVLSGDELSAWAPLDSLPGPVAAFPLPAGEPDTFCRRVRVTTVPYSGPEFARVALAGPERAYVVKVNATDALLAIDRANAPRRVGVPELDPAWDVVSDHRGTVYATGLSATVFQLDENEQVIARTPVASIRPVLARAADGVAYAYDAARGVELVRGSTTTGATFTFPEQIHRWFVVSRDRMIAATRDTIYVLREGDWRIEHQATGLGEAYYFGDADTFGFVHPSYGVIVRDERTFQWSALSDPSPGAPFYAGLALGDGRILATGDGGLMRVWEGGAWCDVPSSTLRALQSIDYDPVRRTGVAVTNDISGTQASAWFDVDP